MRQRQDIRLALLLTAPVLLGFAVLVYYPVFSTLWTSLFDVDLARFAPPDFVGPANYRELLSGQEFWRAFTKSLIVILIALPLELIIGVGGALLLNERFVGRGLVRTLVIVPWMLPPIVNGFMWGWILNGSYGALNGLLFQLGLISEYVVWMGDPQMQLFWVGFVEAWTRYPFVLLIALAALQSVPEEIREASKLDGANFWHEFWHVVRPFITPAVTVAIVVAFIDAFQIFDLIWTLTSGGSSGTIVNPFTKTLMILNYEVVFRELKLGQGSALALIILLLSLLLGLLLAILRRHSSIVEAEKA